MNQLVYGLVLWAVTMIIATPPAKSSDYPHCSEIAHEVQRAWQNSEIREDVARRIIERCLAAEDRGAFDL